MHVEWTENPERFERRGRMADEARRRALRVGAGALSDDELVSLVTGCSDASVVAQMLERGLSGLASEAPEVLLEHAKVGSRGVGRLLAAFELSRRVASSRQPMRPQLATPQAIWQWAVPRVAAARREEFHVLCLNPRNVLLRHVRVAEGSVDQCHVDPREALAPAVTSRASALVLVHNHPSGDPEPSVQDVALTRQLREGAKLLCIRLVDHLVVTPNGYVSMLARGLLGDERPVMPRLQSP